MLEMNYQTVMILEDDAQISPSFKDALQRIVKTMSGIPYKTVMLAEYNLPIERTTEKKHCLHGTHDLCIYGPGLGHRGAMGYLISRSGAESMLRSRLSSTHPSNIGMGADFAMNGQVEDGGYWVEPPIIPRGLSTGTWRHSLMQAQIVQVNNRAFIARSW